MLYNKYEIINGMKVWKSTQSGLEDLAKILLNIPSNERTETNIVYEIIRK